MVVSGSPSHLLTLLLMGLMLASSAFCHTVDTSVSTAGILGVTPLVHSEIAVGHVQGIVVLTENTTMGYIALPSR